MLKEVLTLNKLEENLTHTIAFYSTDNKEVGRLTIHEDHLDFEGDATESAKVFFEQVIKLYSQNMN